MLKVKIIAAFAITFLIPFLLSIFAKAAKTEDIKVELLKQISSSQEDAAEPSIASAIDGSIYLLWVEHQKDGGGNVFLQKLDKDKNLLGEKLQINPQKGKATAWRGDPPTIKIGNDKTIYIGWTARVETNDGTANDLYLSVSRNGGQSFEDPVKVNDDKNPAVHGMHSLAVDKNNNIYFSWLDERYLKLDNPPSIEKTEGKLEAQESSPHHHMEANREVYFAVSKDGGKSFSANRRLAADACPCCKISLLAGTDGRLYVSWRQVLPNDYRHIAITSSNDNGKTFAPVTIVSDDRWQLNGCPVSGSSLAMASDNTLKVVWYSAGDAGKPGLYWSESKDMGKTFSPRVLIYEGILTGTPVLLSDKNKDFRVIWQSKDKIWQLSTQLVGTAPGSPEEVGVGKMPAATVVDNKLFVGFIQNESANRAIWMY